MDTQIDQTSQPASSDPAAPDERAGSPSPTASPSLAIDAVPLLDRSASTPSNSSNDSNLSTRSRLSRASDGGATVVKRRGYMRPQGTSFADSARNRDSVMNLGTISHLQYYFSRTGLLDGKGGQLARDNERKKSTSNKENQEPTSPMTSDEIAMMSMSFYDGVSNYAVSDSGHEASVMDSPSDMGDGGFQWYSGSDPLILPPTVSTYRQRPTYVEPPPDMPVLRRELKEALQDACKVLEESQKHETAGSSSPDETNGFYEVQGLHLLDIITLAIRAAKNYYTAHSHPQKLYAIRSERQMRSDLYQVLEILKRMASRNFRGGLRLLELTGIITWIESIDKLLKKEEQQELREAAERESWIWREGDWSGREREREWLFLKSFDTSDPPLPQWPEASPERTLPNDFLRMLQDGQRLVRLHNALVAKSRRKFGEIKTWHSDVLKPYRMSENLVYWIKAAELRWEIKLTVPVSDVVHDKDEAAWQALDSAVLEWSQVIREELMEEWRQEAQVQEKRKPPEVKIDFTDAGPQQPENAEQVETAAVVSSETPHTNDAIPQIPRSVDIEGQTADMPATISETLTAQTPVQASNPEAAPEMVVKDLPEPSTAEAPVEASNLEAGLEMTAETSPSMSTTETRPDLTTATPAAQETPDKSVDEPANAPEIHHQGDEASPAPESQTLGDAHPAMESKA